MGPPPVGPRNPFNFQTQTIKDNPAIAKSVGQPHSVMCSSHWQSSSGHSLQAADQQSPSGGELPALGLGLGHYQANGMYAKFARTPSPASLSENGLDSEFAVSTSVAKLAAPGLSRQPVDGKVLGS
jgi:hypothetical protein